MLTGAGREGTSADPRGTRAVRLLARVLPTFRGRDFALYHLAGLLNPSWPSSAPYESRHGLRFILDLTDPNHRVIFLLSRFETDLLWVLERLVRPGDVVVEAGTSVGIYTSIAARQAGPAGMVLGFEPLRAARERAAEHLRRNGLANARLLPFALGAEEGRARIYQFADLPSGHASLADLAPARSTAEDCVVTTIDEQVRAHGLSPVRLIKLDVEGSELPALRGARQTLLADRPLLVVEANAETARAFGYTPRAIVDWLAEREYLGFVRRRGRWLQLGPDLRLRQPENMLFVWAGDARTLRDVRDS